MPEVTYTIPNMKCQGCIDAIRKKLHDMEGLSIVDLDLASKKLKIQLDSASLEKSVESALGSIGYPPIVNL